MTLGLFLCCEKSWPTRKLRSCGRLAALDSLVAAKDSGLSPVLQSVLGDEKVRLHAINALAEFHDKNAARALVDQYGKFTNVEKQAAMATLTSRPDYTLAMLDAMEAKKIPHNDITAFTAAQIMRMKNESVTKRLTEVWGQARESSNNINDELNKYQHLIKKQWGLGKADLSNGRLVFNKTCGTCH